MEKPKRTSKQNNSIHKYLDMVAHELQNQGQTLQDVLKKIHKAEITPTTNSLKEVIWKPIQKIVLGKESSTQLTTDEVNKIYEVVAQFLAREFQIDITFPSEEETENYLKSYEETNN